MGLAFVPLTILAMSGVREAEAGLASGVMALLAALVGIGHTGEPVPPRSLSGRQTNPNSLTPSGAR